MNTVRRLFWRIYCWVMCDCWRGGEVYAAHGDGKGGWLCDSCDRPLRAEFLSVPSPFFHDFGCTHDPCKCSGSGSES